ncbi:MAG: hypothetical protein JWN35_14 [Frankiales bacterium]|jgi:hypothetical protein|nr:hypothetical protein [Frankiales bacterium]
MSGAADLEIAGGAAGLAAEYDELAATAALLRTVAADLIGTAEAAGGVLTDPAVLTTAVLDPSGFARTEAAVLAAVAGPHGLLLAAGRLSAYGLGVSAAVVRYAAADRLGAGWSGLRTWLEAAAGLPLLGAGAAGVWLATGHDARDLGSLLCEHPGVVDDVVASTPPFLSSMAAATLGPMAGPADGLFRAQTGHPLLPETLEDLAGLLGLLYPPGSPVVAGRGTDTSPVAARAPLAVGDLLAALAHRDQLAVGRAQGEIDVRRLSRAGADGRPATSWVVDLPGTKDWQADRGRRRYLNDVGTSLTTLAGDPSARVEGVTQALQHAGVRPGEPVMLVGHSQGGLVALRAAEQYARDGRFHVTHVVTAGAPVSRVPVPASVQLLALENRYDLVPRLDGAASPDETNRVSVIFDAQHRDVIANHDLQLTYLPAARAVDDDPDPSLQAWRESASTFLAPGVVDVRTTVWDIGNRG